MQSEQSVIDSAMLSRSQYPKDWLHGVSDQVLKDAGLSGIFKGKSIEDVLWEKAKSLVDEGGGYDDFLAWFNALPFAVRKFLGGMWSDSNWYTGESHKDLLAMSAKQIFQLLLLDPLPVIVFPTSFSARLVDGNVSIGTFTGRETPEELRKDFKYRLDDPSKMRVHPESIAVFGHKEKVIFNRLFFAAVKGSHQFSKVALRYYDSLKLPESFEVQLNGYLVKINATMTLQRDGKVVLLPRNAPGLMIVGGL